MLEGLTTCASLQSDATICFVIVGTNEVTFVRIYVQCAYMQVCVCVCVCVCPLIHVYMQIALCSGGSMVVYTLNTDNAHSCCLSMTGSLI